MAQFFANAYINYPKINPLRMFNLDTGDFFQNSIPYFEEQVGYCQKYQKGDVISGQFNVQNMSHYIVTALLVDNNNITIASIPLTQRITGITNGPDYWDIDYTIPSLIPEGHYFVNINVKETFTTPSYHTEDRMNLISEPLDIATTHENTLLLRCTNETNDFDIAFLNNLFVTKDFYLRVEGGFPSNGYTPYSDDAIYINQIKESTQLSSIPYDSEKVIFGDARGIPNYMIDKINRFMSCTSFFIDDVQYQKANDGVKFEPLGAELYPMRGWSIELSKGNAYSEANEIYQKVILSGGGVEVIDDVPFVPVIGWTDSTGQIYIIGCQLVNQTVVPMPVIPAGYALIHNSNDTFSQLAIINEEVILTDVQVTEWDGSITTHPAARPITAKIAPDSSVVSSGGTPAINITGIRPGDALSVDDINYTDFRGNTIHVEAGKDIISEIPEKNIITNSSGDVIAELDAEQNYEVEDCLLTMPDLSIISIPAGKPFTVPDISEKNIIALFTSENDNTVKFTASLNQQGTYTENINSNVASVIYKKNESVVSLPFSLTINDIFEITIVRTVVSADSQIVLK